MVNKLIELAKKPSEKLGIATDKFLHAIVSIGISFFLGLIFKSELAVILTMIIGIGKEIYDMKKENPTGFDITDLAFDSLGCIIGYLLALLFLF